MMIVDVAQADCGGSGVLWGTHTSDSYQTGRREKYRRTLRSPQPSCRPPHTIVVVPVVPWLANMQCVVSLSTVVTCHESMSGESRALNCCGRQ